MNITKRKLHTRAYEVDAYIEDYDHLRIVGFLKDQKPEGMWAQGDSEPLTIHHMKVDLLIRIDGLTIVAVETEMIVHPQKECPNILPAFDQLVGVSIVRGFTNKVRELYGGPRACTHVAALLNAMAPVAVQSLFGLAEARMAGGGAGNATSELPPPPSKSPFDLNRNSCHVWADEGPMAARIARGEPVPIPMTITKRLRDLGHDPEVAFRRPAGTGTGAAAPRGDNQVASG